VIYEVRKIILHNHSKTIADRFVSQIFTRSIVHLNDRIAVEAATVSLDHKLSMVNAMIYATARCYKAELITSDSHFANLDGVALRR
jgi:predicted nucleic acid-binding protein